MARPPPRRPGALLRPPGVSSMAPPSSLASLRLGQSGAMMAAMRRFLPFVPFLLLSTAACKAVEPAPTEIDELTHFFFLEFDSPETERLIEGVDNLLAWNGKNGDAEGLGGTLTDIDQSHRDAVGLTDKASFEYLNGVFELVPHPGCSAENMGSIYIYPDQPKLFPGQYEDYKRTYKSGKGCFTDKDCDDAEWEIAIEDKLIGKTLEYELTVQLRRLQREDGSTAAVMSRVWMPSPGRIGGDTEANTFFDQSYQIEIFAHQSGSKNLHLYGLWNSGGLRGTDPDADIWSNQYLKGVEDWDDRLDELCNEDRGLWQ
jgi:hypothetical protein